MTTPEVHAPTAPGFRCVMCGKPTPCPDVDDDVKYHVCETLCRDCGCCWHTPDDVKCFYQDQIFDIECPGVGCGCETWGEGVSASQGDIRAVRQATTEAVGNE